MALHRPDPALVGTHDRDRLLVDHRLFEIDVDLGRLGEVGPPTAQLGLLGIGLLHGADFARDLLPLLVVGLEQRLQTLLFLRELAVLAADFHFLELAQRA